MTDTSKRTATQWLAMGLAASLLTYQTSALVEHSQDTEGMTMTMLIGIALASCTVAAIPVLADELWRRARWFVAIPATVALAAPFVLLLGFVLQSAVARTGAIRDVATAEAQASIVAVELLSKELVRAEARLEQATAEQLRECKGGFGRNCDGWTRTTAERQARVDQLRNEIARPAVAKAATGADTRRLANLLGVKPEAIEAYSPMMLPIGIELAIWVLVWVSFSHSLRRRVSAVKPDIATVGVVTQDDPVVTVLKRIGRPVSNDELAQALKISKGQASKLVTERASSGLITRERQGREVAISLPTMH